MQFVEGVKNELVLGHSEPTLHELSVLISEELESNLELSMVSMLPSGTVPEDFIILNAPNSEEHIIAIDFGGTSVKCAIVLRGGFHVVCSYQYEITSHVVDSSFFNEIIEWVCEKVFDYIGEKGNEFLVGTTFSFPLNSNNEIMTMGKGFYMTEGIKNVSILEILEQSFEHVLRNNSNYCFKVSVCGVINDSIAVFLTNQALNGDNDTAMILGTGVNFCFPLPYDRVPKSKLPLAYPEGARVLINSEAGFLGADYLPLKKFYPHHKGDSVPFMPLEYLTSGKWIPLTLKNALAYCGMFPHPSSMEFTGEVLCGILERQQKYTALFGDDFEDVLEITKLLIDRAAFCLFAAISGIYRFQHGRDLEDPIVIGYAGSFLYHCTYYYEKLQEISAGKVTYNFLPDSNLVGAAIHAVYYSGRY